MHLVLEHIKVLIWGVNYYRYLLYLRKDTVDVPAAQEQINQPERGSDNYFTSSLMMSTNLWVFSLQSCQTHFSSSVAPLISSDDWHEAPEIAPLLVFLCEHDRTGFAGCRRSSPLTKWRTMTEDFNQRCCTEGQITD